MSTPACIHRGTTRGDTHLCPVRGKPPPPPIVLTTEGPDELTLILQEVGHALLSPLDPETAETWAKAAATWEASAEHGYDVPALVAVRALCHRNAESAPVMRAIEEAAERGAHPSPLATSTSTAPDPCEWRAACLMAHAQRDAALLDLAETQARATAREQELLAELETVTKARDHILGRAQNLDATLTAISAALQKAAIEHRAGEDMPKMVWRLGEARDVAVAASELARDALLGIAGTKKGARLLFRRCLGDVPTSALARLLVDEAIAAEAFPF